MKEIEPGDYAVGFKEERIKVCSRSYENEIKSRPDRTISNFECANYKALQTIVQHQARALEENFPFLEQIFISVYAWQFPAIGGFIHCHLSAGFVLTWVHRYK